MSIEIAGLTKRFDRTPVLRGIDLSVEPGELLALLGRRAGYVHAAARFKTDAASVRAPERVRAMLERRRAWAAEENLDPEVVAQLFTLLVEYFTRREQRVVDARASGREGGDA